MSDIDPNDMDEGIAQQANSWESEHHKTERERMRLKHARRVAVGRFFRWTLIVSVLGCAGVGAVWEIGRCNARSDAEEDAREQTEFERARRLNRFYEERWAECLGTLGLERCKMIQETGLYECRQQWDFAACSAKRIQERHVWLDEHPKE